MLQCPKRKTYGKTLMSRLPSSTDKHIDAVPREGARYVHTSRKTSYVVVGRAHVQTSKPLNDYDELVVYRGEDGKLWARRLDEFNDGRFRLESD